MLRDDTVVIKDTSVPKMWSVESFLFAVLSTGLGVRSGSAVQSIREMSPPAFLF